VSDQEPTSDPSTGWPGSPAPGADGPPPPAWSPTPDPTAPGYAPPAAPGYSPPAAPGYSPPGGYAPPSAYPPPNVPPPPGYGYGYAGYSGYPVAHDHPQGTTILVLGILSLVVCGLLGPVAWIMGNKAMKEIDANPGAYANRGNVQAGRIIGIIATCLLAFTVAAYGFFILVIVAGSASS
jgi:hypothetical protein